MTDEQSQLANDQVKKTAGAIFQRLQTRIQPNKQYTGEEFLSQSFEIIKKATFKVLSNDDEEDEEEEVPSEDEKKANDEPVNGNSVDQQTLHEEVSSVQTTSIESDVSSTINTAKNGWDTVDDLPTEESKPNPLLVETTEQTTVTGGILFCKK